MIWRTVSLALALLVTGQMFIPALPAIIERLSQW